jgi:glutamate/tyrosine decarboxylase-like PLP-dependent enzyme
VFAALRHLGMGSRRVTRIATDDHGRMCPDALARALAECTAPPLVIAQSGQINTGASDRFDRIAPLVHAAGGWLHVDGAFGLWAQASPRLRHLTAGVEAADSWATDGHKWLQTPYDCGFAIVRDSAAHHRAMDITASYLAPPAAHERHPGATVPELSRRARGFAAWAVIRRLGRSGIAQMVDEDVRLARRLADGIAAIEGAQVPIVPELNQVIVRFGGEGEAGDALTLATIAAIEADGVAFMGPTRWRGQWLMRISVCSIATTDAAVDQTLDAVRAAWTKVQS